MPNTMHMPKAWTDLLEGLALLAKHQSDDVNPFHCERDNLTVMADPAAFTPDELRRLAGLGFVPRGDGSAFTSFRFGAGSA